MAVPKIAVIALVAVIAVPILLGYGMSFQTVQETGYQSGSETDVTLMLHNDTVYSTTNANAYEISGKQFKRTLPNDYLGGYTQTYYPKYNNLVKSYTPLPLDYATSLNAFYANQTDYYQAYTYVNPSGGTQVSLTIVDVNGYYPSTYNKVISAQYSDTDKIMRIWYYNGTTPTITVYYQVPGLCTWSTTAEYTSTPQVYSRYLSTPVQDYVSIANGYSMTLDGTQSDLNTWISPGSGAFEVLITFSLQYTTASFDIGSWLSGTNHIINEYTFNYDSVHQSWSVDGASGSTPILFTPGESNVYQLILRTDSMELHYVKDWPYQLGLANYYRSWTFDYAEDAQNYQPMTASNTMLAVSIYNHSSPVTISAVRVDTAALRNNPIDCMNNVTYQPIDITASLDSETIISNVTRTGSSLQWAGETFNVKDGKITISGKQVKLDGMSFNSKYQSDGTYDCYIGNTFIDNVPTSPTITFDGVWITDVKSDPLTQTTYTKNEWIAGEFAWDGMDTNFLIVGMITCLCAFVGLGLYARKSNKSGLIPLMIVIGCAAAVFFILI